MRRTVLIIILLFGANLYAQLNLDYYIGKALKNAASLNELRNRVPINKLQKDLDKAQNSAFQISLTGNYLFVPYFNNNGGIITTNPNPNAIGYELALTNGGLYSAQINVAKNIFNGGLLATLQNKNNLFSKSIVNNIQIEEHNLRKIVTGQYLNSLQNLLLYDLIKENLSNITKQLNLTGELVEKGFANARDYLLLKIEAKNQQISLAEIWRNYKSGLAQLNSICGLRDTSAVLLDTVVLKIAESFLSSNFFERYSIDSMSVSNQQELFETKYRPQVNIFFNTGLNAAELNNIQRKFGLSAGVNFSLPIFDGNQKDITRQQNSIFGKTIRQNKDYFEKNLFLQRQNGLEKIRSLKSSLDNLQSQIEDYKQVISLAEKQVGQGVISMIEYLTLLKNFIELQKNNINTEINYQIEINNYNYWNW